MAQHKRGKGGKFTSRVVKAGHKLELVMHWPKGDENFERWLKEQQNTKQWCPHCGLEKLAVPQLSGMPVDYDRFVVLREKKAKAERDIDRQIMQANGWL